MGGRTHSAKNGWSCILLTFIHLLLGDLLKSAAFHRFCALNF